MDARARGRLSLCVCVCVCCFVSSRLVSGVSGVSNPAPRRPLDSALVNIHLKHHHLTLSLSLSL